MAPRHLTAPPLDKRFRVRRPEIPSIAIRGPFDPKVKAGCSDPADCSRAATIVGHSRFRSLHTRDVDAAAGPAGLLHPPRLEICKIRRRRQQRAVQGCSSPDSRFLERG